MFKEQKQALWGTVLFSLSVITIMSLFVMIALQMNALNTLDKQNKTLSVIAENQQKIENSVSIQSLSGTIPLHDEEETPNDSTISVEKIDTFVEQDDIVVEEKIVIHNNTKSGKVIGQDMELPDMPTDRKVCTNYTVYGIAGTPHNRMQLAAYTDELGCRRYGDFYIVGLGSAYADRVGETFEIELDTGFTFKIITGDMKADCDTDITNRYCPCMNYDGEVCANILEFIVDRTVLDPKAYAWGGVDWYEQFKGNIVRMTYLGRDGSADWDSYY